MFFYLGCPNQQWIPKKILGFYLALGLSFILLVIAWWVLSSHLSALSTIFALLTIQMFLLGLLPFFARFDKPLANKKPNKSNMVKNESAAHYKPRWWLRICGVLVLCYPLSYTAMLPNQPGIIAKIVNGFFTLHIGGFGGDTIRWIYLGLGVSGSLLFLSGNILWIETRRRRQKKAEETVSQKKSTVVMARLTVGVTMGALIGIVLSFLCAKWLPHKNFDIAWWQQCAYYCGFLLCIAWAFCQSPLRAAKQQLIVLSILTTVLALSSLKGFAAQDFFVLNIVFFVTTLLIAGGMVATLSWLHKRQEHIGADSVWV